MCVVKIRNGRREGNYHAGVMCSTLPLISYKLKVAGFGRQAMGLSAMWSHIARADIIVDEGFFLKTTQNQNKAIEIKYDVHDITSNREK